MFYQADWDQLCAGAVVSGSVRPNGRKVAVFHHIAMFRFRDDADPLMLDAIRTDLLSLPSKIDAIRSYAVGRDANLSDGTWDMVVFAAFIDESGYRSYSQHPDHLVIVQRILALATDRAAVQTSELH